MDGDAISFSCSQCRCTSSTASSVPQDIGEIGAGMSQLFRTVQCLAGAVANLSRQVSALIQNPLPTPPPRLNEPTANSQTYTGNSGELPYRSRTGSEYLRRTDLYGEMKEVEERRKRINSVIVRGIDGPSEAEFLEKFHEVTNHLINETPAATNVFCVNREKKIFRLDIANRETKVALLDSAKDLKGTRFDSVYISKDLTYAQRKDNSRRRALMRSRRDASRQEGGVNEPPPVSGANATPRNLNPPQQSSASSATTAQENSNEVVEESSSQSHQNFQ